MMAYLSLLSISILTVASEATPLYCSDVQSPASGNGHNTDLSQVTTLQYCIVDNCTIMRIDTGQQLDIVYTTESRLIVTPKDGHTSMVIAKVDDELPCLEYPNMIDDNEIFKSVGVLMTSSLIIILSSHTLIVNLLFKELRTVIGKLLSFYNLCIMSTSSSAIALLLMHYWITVNSQTVCHTTTIIFKLSHAGTGLFAACILTHSAYLMYHCYHLKSEMSKKTSKFLFRCYTAYASITLILQFFVTIAYDWRTGNGTYTLLANGHCNFINQYSYKTLFLSDFVVTINKFVQITTFVTYLVYFYKFNVNIRPANISLQYNQVLFRVAIAMGATVGLSYFIFILRIFNSEYADIIAFSGTILLLIQQAVIMASFMCTKKMSALCKAQLCSKM